MAKSIDIASITNVAMLIGASISVIYMLSSLVNEDRPASQTKESKKKAKISLQKLKKNIPELNNLELNPYEEMILSSVIPPDEIKVSFNDIGGLDDIADELQESVILPLTSPQLFEQYSDLLQAPKGVLLYGPPGCGKTMLAKALANGSKANFISIRMSTIMNMWYGESIKLTAALFSLAEKLEPSIIFIDEIDSIFKKREWSDHESTAMLKAEFLTLWDGLTSSERVLVLGATNRPSDIDPAFMRRMPKQFAIKLPNSEQRLMILDKLLQGVQYDFILQDLVDETEGYSGSDLKEMSRNAAINSTREYIKKNTKDGKFINSKDSISLRPLHLEDFLNNSPKNGFVDGENFN
ncbi:hypothetical protein CANARDRAFT_10154 [[Candida] arabinofermentans NRRL YB-2248]|uniref:AAA+ ATPase domain-containing protein n=1 Tax=[Candida] arabinofermentans NRRL YB-2248 TaxID=983967 RepID=A0A1E4STN0_9ASCO|nr:hypothetical protein CANARDRAFT_10154 [[Candida] arabinofermentans NRRL YB-2248]